MSSAEPSEYHWCAQSKGSATFSVCDQHRVIAGQHFAVTLAHMSFVQHKTLVRDFCAGESDCTVSASGTCSWLLMPRCCSGSTRVRAWCVVATDGCPSSSAWRRACGRTWSHHAQRMWCIMLHKRRLQVHDGGVSHIGHMEPTHTWGREETDAEPQVPTLSDLDRACRWIDCRVPSPLAVFMLWSPASDVDGPLVGFQCAVPHV